MLFVLKIERHPSCDTSVEGWFRNPAVRYRDGIIIRVVRYSAGGLGPFLCLRSDKRSHSCRTVTVSNLTCLPTASAVSAMPQAQEVHEAIRVWVGEKVSPTVAEVRTRGVDVVGVVGLAHSSLRGVKSS